MKVTAKLNHLHISPRKVRSVVNLVRGLSAEEALAQLRFLPKRSAGPVFKLLQSAIANAEHNFSLSSEGLKIETLKVDGGPVFKRSRPSSRGRTAPRSKKTSHITLILEGERKTNKLIKEIDKNKRDSEVKTGDTESRARSGLDSRKEIRSGSKMKTAPRSGFVKKMFQRKSI